ncbi:hypothetical protein [Candidatus Protochlamydia sp. W-9]|uniref:hypothetical protein n=1 Tax=Candidatus Protochlamydia sp. W-9 TaxID=1785087 RepID=UPI00096A288B|nr:hypothetical protein [Candidatus Protochlamydia sp. W-9]
MLFSSSLEAQQISVFLQTLVDRMQEELDHPSPKNELDPTATLEDYCRNFFLKKDYLERLEEQNQLMQKLILQRKIYLFNLKKKNSFSHAACQEIEKDCSKIDEKLSTITPQVQDLELQQQEFKQTVEKTRFIQAEMLETIKQCHAKIDEIRVYTSIPTQEELAAGKKQNPFLAIMQNHCDLLCSHIEIMNKINEKKAADLEIFDTVFDELSSDCDVLMQSSYKELQILKQEINQSRQDNEEFIKGVKELQEGGRQFAEKVEKFSEDTHKLVQDGKQLSEEVKELSEGTHKLVQDGKQLSEEVKEFSENTYQLAQDTKQWQKTVTALSQKEKSAVEIIENIKKKECEIKKLFSFSPVQTITTPTSSTCTELVSQQITKRKIILLGPINSLMARLPSHKNFSISFLNKICLIFAWIGIFQIANTVLSFYRPKKNHLSKQKGAFFSAISSSKRKQSDE